MSLTSNGLFSPMNRFGIHKSVLMAYSPDYADPTKVECYVPTRAEVFKMPLRQLKPILCHWFQKAPQSLAASQEQKAAVIKLLKSRYDAEQNAAEITEIENLI